MQAETSKKWSFLYFRVKFGPRVKDFYCKFSACTGHTGELKYCFSLILL